MGQEKERIRPILLEPGQRISIGDLIDLRVYADGKGRLRLAVYGPRWLGVQVAKDGDERIDSK